jgi:hypothetical protein
MNDWQRKLIQQQSAFYCMDPEVVRLIFELSDLRDNVMRLQVFFSVYISVPVAFCLSFFYSILCLSLLCPCLRLVCLCFTERALLHKNKNKDFYVSHTYLFIFAIAKRFCMHAFQLTLDRIFKIAVFDMKSGRLKLPTLVALYLGVCLMSATDS